MFGKGRHHVTSASVKIVRKEGFDEEGLKVDGVGSSSDSGSSVTPLAVYTLVRLR